MRQRTRTSHSSFLGIIAAALLALGCGNMPTGDADKDGGGDSGTGDDADGGSGDMDGASTGCVPECGLGFNCQGSSCVAEGQFLWVVKVTTGTVSEKDPNGKEWDIGLSGSVPPDPFVCLTINGERKCTDYINNTRTPTWNTTLQTASATALFAGIVVEYWDDDVDADDAICPSGTKLVTMDHLKSGTLSVSCNNGSFEVNLRPQ